MPWTSFGKQLPPQPRPAWRNEVPIRASAPIPAAASPTSAPHASQIWLRALMKLILSAKKELLAYLMSSAVFRSVIKVGRPRGA